MRCPYCSAAETRVVDSRLSEPGDAVRRRRQCSGCSARFTTYERATAIPLVVRKRDGRTEAFDRDKLLRGLLRAATKRPVEVARLEALVDSIEATVRHAGGEADAAHVGELALRGLMSADRVAAIRFASVYRNFETLAEFDAELRRLEDEPVPVPDQLPLEDPDPSDPSEPRSKIRRPPATRSRGPERGSGAVDLQRRGHVEHP